MDAIDAAESIRQFEITYFYSPTTDSLTSRSQIVLLILMLPIGLDFTLLFWQDNSEAPPPQPRRIKNTKLILVPNVSSLKKLSSQGGQI